MSAMKGAMRNTTKKGEQPGRWKYGERVRSRSAGECKQTREGVNDRGVLPYSRPWDRSDAPHSAV